VPQTGAHISTAVALCSCSMVTLLVLGETFIAKNLISQDSLSENFIQAY
jgi:hypothetical protein